MTPNPYISKLTRAFSSCLISSQASRIPLLLCMSSIIKTLPLDNFGFIME